MSATRPWPETGRGLVALWVLVVVGLCVPVGGGPAARSPHVSLRLGVVDLEARPGPAPALRHPPAPRPGSAGHAGLAVPSMREPAARSGRSRSPARPCRRPPAPSTPVGLFIAVHIPSRPRRPRAPPPSSTARPLLSRSSRVALHTGGAWCAGGDRRRFEARPGPAPAHRHPPAPRPGSAGLAVPSTKGGAWCAGG